MRKLLVATAAMSGAVVLLAAPAFGHECTNASKNAHNPAAGTQIGFGDGDEPLYVSQGLQQRIEHGVVDPETGEGFHGLVGIDLDGDGVIDASTYIVGPEGEIPLQAQQNGSPDHGVVNICGGTCE